MAVLQQVMAGDASAAWLALDEARSKAKIARNDLWHECLNHGATIKWHSFLNYLTGSNEPKFSQIELYNTAARIVNARLEEMGQKPVLPMLHFLLAPRGYGAPRTDYNPNKRFAGIRELPPNIPLDLPEAA